MFEDSDKGLTQPYGGWAAVRRVPRRTDLTLSTAARSWVRRLPPGRRPLVLCATFPRVANRLAWCWSDAPLCGQVLQDLLVDRRGGRQGFPAAVVRELQRLREFGAAGR